MSSPAVSPFAHTVGQLAAAHRLRVRVDVTPLPGHGAHLSYGRRPVIAVSTSLLAEPAPVQEFAAAHEVAHLVLGHGLWSRLWPSLLCGLVLGAVQVGVLWLAMNTLTDHDLAVAVVLVVGGLGPLVGCLAAWALLAWRTRGCEIAADRLALSWGYTLTGSQAALNRGESRLTTHRLYRPFRMHPLPDQRVAAGDVSQGSAAKEPGHDRTDPP